MTDARASGRRISQVVPLFMDSLSTRGSASTEHDCDRCVVEMSESYRNGWASPSRRACRAGFYLFGNRSIEGGPEVCQPCPEGLRCYTSGLTVETVDVAEGWWRPDVHTPVALRCKARGVCLGVTANSSFSDKANNGCRSGHTGPFCEICQTDHIRYLGANFCTDCSAGLYAEVGISMSLTGAIVLLAIAMLVYKTMAGCGRMAKHCYQKAGRMAEHWTRKAGSMVDQGKDVLQINRVIDALQVNRVTDALQVNRVTDAIQTNINQERMMQHVTTVRAIWSSLAIKAKIVISAIQAHASLRTIRPSRFAHLTGLLLVASGASGQPTRSWYRTSMVAP